MEKSNQVSLKLGRVLVRALGLGALAALVAYGRAGYMGAFGALAGCLAAGIYVSAYLNSHLAGPAQNQAPAARSMAKGAALRLTLAAAGGFAAYLFGRHVLIAYLASFAVAFAFLALIEIRRIRANRAGGPATKGGAPVSLKRNSERAGTA